MLVLFIFALFTIIISCIYLVYMENTKMILSNKEDMEKALDKLSNDLQCSLGVTSMKLKQIEDNCDYHIMRLSQSVTNIENKLEQEEVNILVDEKEGEEN